VYVGSRPGFRGRVHAFEPVPDTFVDLRAVVEQAGLTGPIVCHNVGLSSASKDARMVIPDALHSGLATMATEANGASFGVTLRPLDSLGLPDPSVVKLDVEGHELDALAGAEEVIRRARPMIVFENWLPADDAGPGLAPLDWFGRHDYRLFLPVWWVGPTTGVRLARPGCELDPSRLTRLALVPIDPTQRCLLAEREDLLACPAERVGELQDRFGFTPVRRSSD
jgi:FkbM family methyltransferase